MILLFYAAYICPAQRFYVFKYKYKYTYSFIYIVLSTCFDKAFVLSVGYATYRCCTVVTPKLIFRVMGASLGGGVKRTLSCS